MLYVSLFIFAVLVIAAILPNHRNASSLLSGYNQMPAELQTAFPLSQYLRAYRRWMFSIASIYLLLEVVLHYFFPAYSRLWSVLWLFVGLAAMIFQMGRSYTPQYKLRTMVASLLLLVMGIGVAWLGFSQQKENQVLITAEYIDIQGPYGLTIPRSDLQSWHLSDTLPALRNKRYGYSDGALRKGVFSTKAGEKVRVFVRDGEAPYLYLELKTGEKIWYGLNSAEQMRLASTLLGFEYAVE